MVSFCLNNGNSSIIRWAEKSEFFVTYCESKVKLNIEFTMQNKGFLMK